MPRALAIALYLAGRPWSVWVVAAAIMLWARASGAGGLDAIVIALGPAVLWLLVSFGCRTLSRATGNPFRQSIVPKNQALPVAQLAVVVVPDAAAVDPSLDAAHMAKRLSPDLQRILQSG